MTSDPWKNDLALMQLKQAQACIEYAIWAYESGIRVDDEEGLTREADKTAKYPRRKLFAHLGGAISCLEHVKQAMSTWTRDKKDHLLYLKSYADAP